MLKLIFDKLKEKVCKNNAGKRFIPSDKDRLREFFIFCADLENHPFVLAHLKGGNFQLIANFPEGGKDTVDINFDEYHLESLLTRVRQFLYDYELFYFKDLRRSIVKEFGENSDFEKKFYSKLTTSINRKLPSKTIKAFANGKDIIEGRTYKELLETRLYLGAIHSERRLNAPMGSFQSDMIGAHIVVSKHFLLELAPETMKVVQNIFSFRRWIHKVAEEEKMINHFDELSEFDSRVKDAISKGEDAFSKKTISKKVSKNKTRPKNK